MTPSGPSAQERVLRRCIEERLVGLSNAVYFSEPDFASGFLAQRSST